MQWPIQNQNLKTSALLHPPISLSCCPVTCWSSPSLYFETSRWPRTRLVRPALRGAAPGAVPGCIESGDADHVPRVAGQVFEPDGCLREEKDLHFLRVILDVALPVINLLGQWDVLVYPTPISGHCSCKRSGRRHGVALDSPAKRDSNAFHHVPNLFSSAGKFPRDQWPCSWVHHSKIEHQLKNMA